MFYKRVWYFFYKFRRRIMVLNKKLYDKPDHHRCLSPFLRDLRNKRGRTRTQRPRRLAPARIIVARVIVRVRVGVGVHGRVEGRGAHPRACSHQCAEG